MNIYVDINILANFNKKYQELYHTNPNETLNDNWQDFITGRHFITLEVNPDGIKLIEYLKTLSATIHIISSTGSNQYHMNVVSQRNTWLYINGYSQQVYHVVSKLHKLDFANKDAILVDLDYNIVLQFNKLHGVGIQYTNVQNTIEHIETEYLFYERYKL